MSTGAAPTVRARARGAAAVASRGVSDWTLLAITLALCLILIGVVVALVLKGPGVTRGRLVVTPPAPVCAHLVRFRHFAGTRWPPAWRQPSNASSFAFNRRTSARCRLEAYWLRFSQDRVR